MMESFLAAITHFIRSSISQFKARNAMNDACRITRMRSRHVVCSFIVSLHRQEPIMPEKKTIERAEQDKREGKAPSTQAGEFVREEMEHIREGKHGARSTKQAIAIGLSKARRAGVELPPPKEGTVSEKTRRSAQRAEEAGQRGDESVSPKRSRATMNALNREGHAAPSKPPLARQARSAAHR